MTAGLEAHLLERAADGDPAALGLLELVSRRVAPRLARELVALYERAPIRAARRFKEWIAAAAAADADPPPRPRRPMLRVLAGGRAAPPPRGSRPR